MMITSKKIATLTWRFHNFGTALQSYALCMWINQNGAECKQITYSLPSRNQVIRVNPITLKIIFKKLFKRIHNYFIEKANRETLIKYNDDISKSHKRFCNFYDLIPTEKTEPLKKNKSYFDSNYDFIVVGSDQVWSPKYFTETYFLDFVSDCKKAAYAPSLGVNFLTEWERNFLLPRINKFRYISVREATSARLIGLDEKCVMCDPVLLFDKDQWNDMLGIIPKSGDYIFVYTLSHNKWYIPVIEQTKKMYRVNEVIVVTPNDILFLYKSEGYTIKANLGPIEWIEYLQNAKVVLTDSFHGVCFSLIYRKEFLGLMRFQDNYKESENSRVTDLLNKLGLKNHVMKKGCIIDKSKFKSDESSYLKLDTFRKKSVEYLRGFIN